MINLLSEKKNTPSGETYVTLSLSLRRKGGAARDET